ncbi:MAG TPA: hypothetical protein VEC37_10355 [Bacillota bacterium]|nr:hypothetical protein [Bacillota bacterium]
MQIGKRIFTIPLLGIFVSLLLFSGCSRDNIQQSLSQKRLGVELYTEKGDRTVLTDALANYLRQQLPDTEIMTLNEVEPVSKANGNDSALNADPLDYFLKVRLSEIKIKISPDLDLSDSSLKLQFGRKCQLTLSYRLTRVTSGQVVLRGQTEGNGESSGQLHVEDRKINLKLTGDEDQVIEAAMFNAVQNSQFLKK